LGVGPGSSARDYDLAGVAFEERWARFDESVRALRAHLGAVDLDGVPVLPPQSDGIPIWVASWGSEAGLRRVARLGDGWLASAYNADPAKFAAGREVLGAALAHDGRTLDGFPCALATMWTYITDDERVGRTRLEGLAAMLNRPVEAQQVLVGPVEHCASIVRAYADAGVDRLFIWPLADVEAQLERFMREVVPAAGR
jgi:alkanesulfonate monooxygenase SsuD/methylene tetrahydromethanopterin reductase-like flavin-dependent oxidoreductase (luciferase family)